MYRNMRDGLVMPSMLSVLSERGFYEEAKEYGLYSTVSNAAPCTYVCPSKRPIVQFVRLAKSHGEAMSEQSTSETKKGRTMQKRQRINKLIFGKSAL